MDQSAWSGGVAGSTAVAYELIDHTDLRPEATADDIRHACEVTQRFGCASVCVRPEWVALARSTGDLPISVVIAFPTGEGTPQDKARETRAALRDGATEIDMVIDVAALQRGESVVSEILAVREAAPGLCLKVILETAALTDEQIIAGCLAAELAGADYVKTSTGYHPAGGATTRAVSLMRATVPALGVKASGGIRSSEDLRAMVAAGATRIGTSATERLT